MRSDDQQPAGVISYVSLDERIPHDHPLRFIRKSVDEVLRAALLVLNGKWRKRSPKGQNGAVTVGADKGYDVRYLAARCQCGRMLRK